MKRLPWTTASMAACSLFAMGDASARAARPVMPNTLANDECVNATPVTSVATFYSSEGATDSGVGMACVFNGGLTDIWYAYTATESCPVTIDFGGSHYDTAAAIYTGDCGNLVLVDCDDDGSIGLTSLLEFDAVAGTRYLLQVSGFDGESGFGMFSIGEDRGIGPTICEGEPNTTGARASLKLFGSRAVADNDLRVTVTELPLHSIGYVVTSMEESTVANPGGSQGDLCIAGATMGRFANQPLDSGATGAVASSLDLTRFPGPNGIESVMVGDRRYFQYWYRDDDPMGAPSSNFSSARRLRFL